MGQAATKAREAHAHATAKPKTGKKIVSQKIRTAQATGLLALSDSKLKKIPSEVFQLTQLRTLDLSNNRIHEIPNEINQLKSLKTLKLQSNQLTNLPDLSALTSLTTLVVDGNQLVQFEKLPPNLTKLSLSNNRLQEISIHLTTLRQLKELDLSDNKISNIPDHIKDLSELEDLKLDRNLLEELPQVLAKCGKLKTLSTRFNRLKGDKEKIKKRIYQCISSEILESSSVQILNLDGNPMTKFDLEAMQGVEVFLQRRQLLKDKEIHGGLSTDTSLCGLD